MIPGPTSTLPRLAGAIVLAAIFFISGAQASEDVTWKNGLKFNTENASIKIGGRIHNDFVWMTSSADDLDGVLEDLDGATEFRRARLAVSGKLYDTVEFKAQYDFAHGSSAFKSVYMGLPTSLGTIRVGQVVEPFSLEELTSSNYLTFMERGIINGFVPSRRTGIILLGSTNNKVVTYSGGYFRNSDSFGDDVTGTAGRDLTGRLTASPIYRNKGGKVVHVGVGVSHREIGESDSLQVRIRPSAHLHPKLISTPEMDIDNYTLVNVEGAVVLGPLSLQGEVLMSSVSSEDYSDPSFTSYYAMASYFITGEHRAYKRSSGKFNRIKVSRNYTGQEGGGPGAWEVAARIGSADLNDGDVMGGQLTDITLGVNWYLNNASRVMFNFVHADVKDVGTTDTFQTRFQIDF